MPACLVSVLAYAGLRPAEALALRWGDVGEGSVLVQRALADGGRDADEDRAAPHGACGCRRRCAATCSRGNLPRGTPATPSSSSPAAMDGLETTAATGAGAPGRSTAPARRRRSTASRRTRCGTPSPRPRRDALDLRAPARLARRRPRGRRRRDQAREGRRGRLGPIGGIHPGRGGRYRLMVLTTSRTCGSPASSMPTSASSGIRR